jgi:dipeptidyl-peptidase-4
MKHIASILVVLACCIQVADAQNKKLTLEDAIYANPRILPDGFRSLQWKANTDKFTFIENKKFVEGSAISPKKDTILSFEDINSAYIQSTGDTMYYLPHHAWESENELFFKYGHSYFTYSTDSKNLKKLITIPDDAENIDLNITTSNAAFTRENNLFILKDGKEIAISTESDKGIVYGQEVHRREFGINTGTFWSPNGNFLAFYRKDETMVADYPIVDINTRIATVVPEKYPMAGEKSHHVTLGVYDLKADKIKYLETGGPKDQYLARVSWGPEDEYIYVVILNRDQNHLKVNKYNPKTGKLVKTLFEEKDDKYVEPERGLFFVKNQSNQFIWFSERDGYDHLYLYTTEGELIRNLTDEEIIVDDILGFDENGKKVFFEAYPANTIQKHIYVSDLKTGKVEQLTQETGTHNARLSGTGKYFIDTYSSHTQKVIRKYSIYDSKGLKKQELLESKDPLREYNLGETKIIELKADDGTPLFGYLIKPPDFKKSKKYPAIVYVYGGPHAQLVNDSWLAGAGIFLNYMAQQGYVILTVDNRGSANRGKKFEQAIFRNLGTVELSDQMKGIEYLKSLPFVDEEKIGVDGWSYGGFMTISLLLKHNDVFKVGCAGGPVIDWKYYEVMYGERYMDTPQDNPEGYKNACLLNHVDKLKGKLLIIHGTSDPVVVWQHSQAFLKAAIEKGVQLDYFVYPGHKHNVSGKDRMHLYKKFILILMII